MCPEAPRKKNSNREGQKEMKRGDCNKAATEGTQMRDLVMFMAPKHLKVPKRKNQLNKGIDGSLHKTACRKKLAE